jgi:beta-glucanase (GH16 family)
MESIGDSRQVWGTTHSGAQPSKGAETRVQAGAFHTYAVAWDPKEIVWFIDGKEVQRQPTPADMHKPMFLVANLAVGGKWPGMPDERTSFPVALQIDAIRAYRFAS